MNPKKWILVSAGFDIVHATTSTKYFVYFSLSLSYPQHLLQQQGALSEMVKIIKQDFKDLKLIEEGLKDMAKSL